MKSDVGLTLISRTFRLSSLRLLSLTGLPLTELDGSDDKLPCLLLAFLKWPSIRPGRAPSIFKTSLYIVSRPSSCDLMCRKPWVSVSESLTDWPAPHWPPSSESKSKDLVVVDVMSSRPNTKTKLIVCVTKSSSSPLRVSLRQTMPFPHSTATYNVSSSSIVLASWWLMIASVRRVSAEWSRVSLVTVQ